MYINKQDKEELVNRTKNGALAGAGAFAITALSCYRVSQEMFYEPETKKVMNLSFMVAIVSALGWFLMPAAARPVEEHIEEVKRTVTAPIKVLLNQILNTQKNAASDMQKAREKFYNRTGSTTSTTSTPGGWTFVGGQKTDSYTRGYNKAHSVFDNSTNDDYDPLDDDDLEDFYKTLDDE